MNRKNSGRKRNRQLVVPFILSVLIHLLLLLLLLLSNQDFFKLTAKKEKPEKDNFIEITEFQPPEDEKTEPPKDAKFLAKKSHKAKEEKTKDSSTRISKRSIPKPKIVKKPQVEKKPSKKSKKNVAKKKQEKVKQKKQVKKKNEVLRDHKLASLPKKKWLRREQQNQNTPESIARKQSLPAPNLSTPFPSNLPPLQGSKNVRKKEDTVDLNTKEFKYYSYFIKLKRQIEGVWHYPTESAQRGEQGHLNVIFTITKTGILEDIKIVKSSGFGRLDSEAIRAIRVASPYNPFPKSWEGLERLNVKATFEYNFSWRFR